MKDSVFLFGLAVTLGVLPAHALPIVAVDLDPGTAGVQSTATMQVGELLQVEVLLDTDGNDVSNFEFDIAPGGVGGFPVTATGISVNELFGSGDTFGFPNTVIDEETLDNGAGEAAGSANQGVFGTAANGSGLLLATLAYQALAEGLISLDLNDVGLFDMVGAPILPLTVNDGQITVTAASAVPVPGSILLLAAGLFGLPVFRRLGSCGSLGALFADRQGPSSRARMPRNRGSAPPLIPNPVGIHGVNDRWPADAERRGAGTPSRSRRQPYSISPPV